jgi:hypothetical protein
MKGEMIAEVFGKSYVALVVLGTVAVLVLKAYGSDVWNGICKKRDSRAKSVAGQKGNSR